MGQDAALTTIKAVVLSFYNLLDNANKAQKGSKGNTKGKSDELEQARIAMCVAQFANLGGLIQLYALTPTTIEPFFDVETIRNHKQLIYTSHLAPNQQENLLVHTFSTGDTFKVLSTQNLRLFLSDSDSVFAGTALEVPANTLTTINVNDFMVNLATNRYLLVVNQSGALEAEFKVELL
jgi:hypothetical protein